MGQKGSQYAKTPLMTYGGQTKGLACATKKKSGGILKQNILSCLRADYTIVDDQKIPACKVTGKEQSKMAANLDMADGGQTEGLAGVTKKKSNWILKQKFWSWSGGDYTIVDDQKIPACNVTGNVSLRNGMFFYIPGRNKPIAYMQEKLLALRTTWKLFTFLPNFEGQESTCNKKVGHVEMPIYQYALMDAKMASFLGEMRFKRYVTNDETQDTWKAKVKFNLKLKLDITKTDTNEVVAQIGQTSFSQYAITAAKGVARLSLIAFAVACQKISQTG